MAASDQNGASGGASAKGIKADQARTGNGHGNNSGLTRPLVTDSDQQRVRPMADLTTVRKTIDLSPALSTRLVKYQNAERARTGKLVTTSEIAAAALDDYLRTKE